MLLGSRIDFAPLQSCSGRCGPPFWIDDKFGKRGGVADHGVVTDGPTGTMPGRLRNDFQTPPGSLDDC